MMGMQSTRFLTTYTVINTNKAGHHVIFNIGDGATLLSFSPVISGQRDLLRECGFTSVITLDHGASEQTDLYPAGIPWSCREEACYHITK